MGLRDGLKKLREKVAGTVGDRLDKVLGDQPDSAAAPGATSTDDPVTMSKVDTASAGFPPELR